MIENHERYYFRTLRSDEEVHHLVAKDSHKPPPRDDDEVQRSIHEHIKSGSSGYLSPWISTTAELNVALAFSGVINRVAVIPCSQLHREKQVQEIVNLDKGYQRRIQLTEEDAIMRSRRSDEVLVFKEIKCAELLTKKIVNVTRQLHPNYLENDEQIFPVITTESSIESIETMAGPNKGLSRILIDGKRWVARSPRPNYDLEKEVLFNEKLVQLCEYLFTIMCAYRLLGAPVPECALYIFQVNVDHNSQLTSSYQSAFILIEDINLCQKSEEAVATIRNMFPADLILGNWDPLDGASDLNSLMSPWKGAIHEKNGKVLRLSVDRAMGIVYPEDRCKPEKIILEFEATNLGLLKKNLEENFQWCYSSISKRAFIQMSMEYINNMRLEELKTLLEACPELPWKADNNPNLDIWKVTEARIKAICELLPFYEIFPATELIPLARDGHGAVSLSKDDQRKMFVRGGNSEKGPLNDFWEFNFNTSTWNRLPDMPLRGRYSFSMHLFLDRYVIVFGGCGKQGKKARVDGELAWYDINQGTWYRHHAHRQLTAEARCRHGSYFRKIDERRGEMTVLGGSGRSNEKRDDQWKLLVEEKQPGSLTFEWTEYGKSSQKIHRCFLFEHEDSYYVLGGFGRNLRNIETISNVSRSTVVTRTSSLPASEKKSFGETKSLAGFAALYDQIEQRVILIGGGNLTSNNAVETSSTRTDMAFGKPPEDKEVNSWPRILILQIEKNWKWETHKSYASLDARYKLPNLLHWTAVYLDHSVILYGGRRGNKWSNKMFKLDLRPELKGDIDQTKEEFEIFFKKLWQRCRKYEGNKKDQLLEQIRDHAQRFEDFK